MGPFLNMKLGVGCSRIAAWTDIADGGSATNGKKLPTFGWSRLLLVAFVSCCRESHNIALRGG
jgi:hypothetical protein